MPRPSRRRRAAVLARPVGGLALPVLASGSPSFRIDVPGLAGSTLMEDSFDRADGLITAAAPTGVSPNHVWQPQAGTWSVSGNEALTTHPGGVLSVRTQLNWGDHLVRARIRHSTSGTVDVGLMVRCADTNNFVGVTFTNTGLTIFKRTSGVNAAVGTAPLAAEFGATYVYEVQVLGDVLTVRRDGVQVAGLTLTGDVAGTRHWTRVGLASDWGGSDTNSRFLDFQAVALAAPADAVVPAIPAALPSAASLANATDAARPLYRVAGLSGRAALDFDGVDDILTGALSFTNTSNTIFVVAQADVIPAGTTGIFSGQAPDWYVGAANTGVTLSSHLQGDGVTQQTNTGVGVVYDLNPALVSYRWYAGAFGAGTVGVVHRDNGSFVLDANVGTGITASNELSWALGSFSPGAGQFNGKIAEVIVYPVVLGVAEMQAVELYLRRKYAIV